VAKLVKKLKQEHVSGIIVDLRYNPGGSLEEAIKFTGLFIKEGPVVQARNPDGQTIQESDTEPDQIYTGPLMVLVNRFSASAAEIAAAALQDYGRALVVGDVSTHGKGTVQSLNSLKPFMINSTNDPGELKITIRKFYRISGASTQLKGVTPDIILPDTWNYSTQIGESNLDNPLAWDTIAPASYDKLNLVQPYLGELRDRSDARVLTNQDFTYVRQDIEQIKKTQVERTATLNEHDAIKEREQEALKNRTRDAERQSRPDPGIKIYELTVENSAEPGLPPPENWLGQTNAVALLGPKLAVPETKLEAINAGDLKPTPLTGHPAAEVKKSTPPFDPILDESEHIFEDYISLLQKNGNFTVNP
jgi:carboxyl-terminal processing protease